MSETIDSLLLEDGMVLTEGELVKLSTTLMHGDRAGFYATYYAMTDNLDGDEGGSTEAALQSKISTFSDDVGAIAYYSNALLQESLTSTNYAGIYHLSQDVAESAYNYILRDFTAGGGEAEEEVDGLLSRAVFFDSAKNAWAENNEGNHFPGNLLSDNFLSFLTGTFKVLVDYIDTIVSNGGVPDREDVISFVNENDGVDAGTRASALAALYVLGTVGETGKHLEQYTDSSRYQVVESTDGRLEYIVDTSLDKVVAVEDNGIGLSQSWQEALLESGFTISSLFGMGSGAGGLVFLHSLLGTTFGDYAPPNGDWTKLTESTEPSVYDGDNNTAAQENDFSDFHYYGSLRLTATSSDDILFGSADDDVIDGQGGSDFVFGGDGNDQLSAGISGADTLWGQNGDDTLIGGSGDSIFRGGDGNDTIFADGIEGNGGGADTVIGGAGDDVVHSSFIGDVLIGNDGDDSFFLEDSNGIVSGLPEPEIPLHPTIIWGGDGADEYHIAPDTSIVFLYADGITTKDIVSLNVDGLSETTAEFYSDADVIIINPDENDKFYIGNDLVSDFTVQSTVNFREFDSGDDFYRDGNYNGEPLYVPGTYKHFYSETTNYEFMFGSEQVILSTSESEYFGSYGGGDYGYFSYLSFMDSGVTIAGFTQGAAGITFEGESVRYEEHDTTTTRDLVSYDIDYYNWDSVREEYFAIIKNPVFSGPAVVEEEQYNSDDHLIPDNFYASVKETFDPSGYSWYYNLDPTPEAPDDAGSHENTPTPDDDIIILDDLASHIVDADAGDDFVITGGGDDSISGGAGKDVIFGGSGDDVIAGGDGNDGLAGGQGDDRLDGGGGSDSYAWGEGDANDTIVDGGAVNDVDEVQIIGGVGEADFTVSRSGNDLVLTVDGTEHITVVDQFLGDGIESISFDGGPTWDRAYFEGLADEGPTTGPWVANDDQFWTTADTAIVVDFTGNDVVPTGANVNAYTWASPQHGEVAWNGSGYTYTPDAGFTGVDWFTYGLQDGDNDDAVMTPDGAFVIVHVGETYDPNDHTGITQSVGTGNDNYFSGSSFDDTVHFTGGEGGVSGDGKAGDDIVVFDGNISDYEILGEGDYFTIHNTATDDSFQFTNMEYIRFNGTTAISLADIVANSNYDPGDTWYEPEPIGGLV